MQSIANVVASFSRGQGFRGETAWPCWRDSTRAEIHWTPVPRLDASRWWHALRAWDRGQHEKGKHGGRLGRVALAVYHVLALDYVDHASGRLDPSLDAIAARAAVSRRSVVQALARLREIGAVDWQRRCEVRQAPSGRWELHQRTNAYRLPASGTWKIRCRIPDAPPPAAGTWGDHPPIPDEIAAAATAAAAGRHTETLQHLSDAPAGTLAAALARLGRAIDRGADPTKDPDRSRFNECADAHESTQEGDFDPGG